MKDELSGSGTQGSFSFGAAGGRTAFQNFLTGNRDGACGSTCTYNEPTIEIASQFRFARYEFYIQDSWKVRPNVTLDLGVRYSLQPPVKDENDVLTNFSPALYNRASAPRFSSAAATTLLVGSGDFTNGIVIAGQNSPHGRGIYATDKNNIMPRVGFSWDRGGEGSMVVRGGYGIYYDQALVGIFLQNAFVNPPFVAESPGPERSALEPRRRHHGDHGGAFGADRLERPLHHAADPAVEPRRAAQALLEGRDRHRLRRFRGRQPHPARRHQRADSLRGDGHGRRHQRRAALPWIRGHQLPADHREVALSRPARGLPP